MILRVSKPFEDLMGYREEELKGKNISMFATEGDRNNGRVRETWEQLRKGQAIAGEFNRLAKGGREVWLQTSYSPIRDVSGKVFKVVGYYFDVSEQRKVTEELKRKVDSMLEVVSAAKEGDLTREITVRGTDAIGQMGEGLEKFFEDLRNRISSIGKTPSA